MNYRPKDDMSDFSRRWLEGYYAGLAAYAWWKDGIQYVGSCGTTLQEAQERMAQEMPLTHAILYGIKS